MSRYANFWTDERIKSMTGDELIQWSNDIFENMEQAKKINITLQSEEIFHLIQAELKRRKLI